MVSDLTPHVDHWFPKSECLEHPDASCNHDNDIENSFYDACHGYVSVDKPQTDSDDYQAKNDVEKRLNSAC